MSKKRILSIANKGSEIRSEEVQAAINKFLQEGGRIQKLPAQKHNPLPEVRRIPKVNSGGAFDVVQDFLRSLHTY